MVLTASPASAYDDVAGARYHFPATYLRAVQQGVGDQFVYYEPRRDAGASSSGGRQSYFAVGRILRVEPDAELPGHYYAFLSVPDYLEFDRAVPFREGAHYYESGLSKDDGSTNKGAFGRAVRAIPDEEFGAILQAGFTRDLADWERADRIADVPDFVDRPIVTQVLNRKFRDEAFRRHVREAYKNTCAVTGLCLINGGGRPEVEAAHIRPVERDGPDAVSNGLALTRTVHWLFDRGLVSVDDSYRLLISPRGLPVGLAPLVRANAALALPSAPEHRPHPKFLEWHRTNCFKG